MLKYSPQSQCLAGCLTLEVRNLPADIKEKEVKYIFSKYGSVRSTDAQGSDVYRRFVCQGGNVARGAISRTKREPSSTGADQSPPAQE